MHAVQNISCSLVKHNSLILRIKATGLGLKTYMQRIPEKYK